LITAVVGKAGARFQTGGVGGIARRETRKPL
jgi:hypothetical protein